MIDHSDLSEFLEPRT